VDIEIRKFEVSKYEIPFHRNQISGSFINQSSHLTLVVDNGMERELINEIFFSSNSN
jgi:hypothetical protein